MGAPQEQEPEKCQCLLPLAVPRHLGRILCSLPERDLHESRRQNAPNMDAQVPAAVQLHEAGGNVNTTKQNEQNISDEILRTVEFENGDVNQL